MTMAFGALETMEGMPERTYWHSDTVQLSDRYTAWTEEARTVVPEPQGELVSPLCKSGLHAPALDIDWPAELEPLAVPRPDLNLLTVGRRVTRRPYSRLLVALAQTALIRPGYAQLLINEAGAHVYPFIVALETPARLVPSSTPDHHHPYLDTELPWDDYALLLKRFEAASIIQRGFTGRAWDASKPCFVSQGVYKQAPTST